MLERLSQILDLTDRMVDLHGHTYDAELNRQCQVLSTPAYIVTAIAWLPYIHLDMLLFPKLTILIFLRLGLTAVGLTALILNRFPYFKKRAYGMFMVIGYYLGIATALILGLVAGNPIYMGGFALVIFCYLLLPLKPLHILTILGCTIVLFLLVGISNGMSFVGGGGLYGLFNLLVALVVSGGGIFILDSIKQRSYEKSILLESANDKLTETSLELAEMNDELQKANDLKNDLMGVAAHDLKDPLQIIILYTDMLRDRMRDDPFAVTKLDKIYKSSEKMIQLISGMLEIASIESGKLVPNLKEIEADKAAKSVTKSLTPLAENKKQTLHLDATSGQTITADKMLLNQILKNLVSNAIKFSPHEKNIWFSVMKREKNGGGVIFTVRDEGPGLTVEDKEKLFRKFQRLSNKPTGGENSTGLGLAITKDLINLHGGSIRVESETGKGCTFIVELPQSSQ